MKVTYLENVKNNKITKEEKKVVGFKTPVFYLSKVDFNTFNTYEHLHNAAYGHTFRFNGHIINMLKDRKNVKSLSITPQESSSNKYIDFDYGEDLYKELMAEASKLKIDIDDYIRGIVYSRTIELESENRARYKRLSEWREDNRIIDFNFCIERDLRKKLEKKYGNRSDEEYKDLVFEILNDAATQK